MSSFRCFVFLASYCALLQVVDSKTTLYLVSTGAIEFNPVMAWYLDQSTTLFLLAKYGLAVAGIFILGIAANKRPLLVNIALAIVDLIYSVVVIRSITMCLQ